MSTAQAVELRSPYVDFWNTVLVPKFNTWRHILSGGLSLHSEKVFPALALCSSDHVLDVGCGWGDTTIKIAHRLGPAGSVVGLDCCDGFLEAGRAEVKAAGLTNVTFLEADVQTYPFKPVYDFCFSRFGTQFFENPVAGLRNMRVALKPNGLTPRFWSGETSMRPSRFSSRSDRLARFIARPAKRRNVSTTWWPLP